MREKLPKASFEVSSQNPGVPGSSYDLQHCKNGAGLADTPCNATRRAFGGRTQSNMHVVEGGVLGALVVVPGW